MDCLYRIEEWRNAPKDVCPFSVYMLSSKNGNTYLFCWILFEQKRWKMPSKSTTKTLKVKLFIGMILP